MNILYVSSKKRWGGVSSWMLRTADALEARGHTVQILAHPDGRFVANTKGKKNVIAYKLGMDYNPLAIFFLMRILRANRVQAIVTNIEKEVVTGGIAARICGIPNIRRVGREDDFNDRWKVRWHHQNLVDRCIVPCNLIRDNALKRAPWLDNSQFTTIYNGKNLRSFSREDIDTQRRKWQVPDSALVVGLTSQLSRQKSVDSLVRVFKRLQERYTDICLVITGEGKEKEKLQKMVRDEHLEARVIFSGFSTDPIKTAAAYDIAVSSSSFEGFPNTVVEYFAAARPVVTTDAGGVGEMVNDHENAILVPVGDDERLYAGIAELIENSALRSRLAENAAQTIVNGFSEDRMVEQLEHFFRETISLK